MISHSEITKVLKKYNPDDIHIVIFGSHSAKEMEVAAKRAGYPTILYVQEGRESLYDPNNLHLFDEIIKRPKFSQMTDDDVQDTLRINSGVILPNRSFTVYVRPDPIENDLLVPMYGTREMLRMEDRNEAFNQYTLMEKAGMRFPKQFKPDEIDRPVIVKVQQAKKSLERAFFYVATPQQYEKKSKRMIRAGEITQEDLDKARIEEVVIGPRFNGNVQRYGLNIKSHTFQNDYDLVGFGDRIQVNVSGILNLTAEDQKELLKGIQVRNEEIGHKGVTMRESQQTLVYEQAEKFIKASDELFHPGIIGPMGLQGGIQYKWEDGQMTSELEFVVFDISPRNSGDPHIAATSPEMENLTIKHWDILKDLRHVPWNNPRRISGPLDLAMMELEVAANQGRLSEILT